MKRTALTLALSLLGASSMPMVLEDQVVIINGTSGDSSVEVNGGDSWGDSWGMGGTSSGTGSGYGGTSTSGSGGGTYAYSAGNLSPDVRCNPVAKANELIRTTTSKSDGDTKFLAANTLFRLIYAQLGGSAMQSALAILPKATNTLNGKTAVLWKTTWYDGSTSTHLVFPFLPPLFTDQQPSVNGNTTPATYSTACPVKG